MGLLSDVPLHGWENGGQLPRPFLIEATHLELTAVHPQLQFISHFPSTVMGEQLVAQLFRAIPEQQWLFKYGRVPLSFILSDYVYQVCRPECLLTISSPNNQFQRVTATVKQSTVRCKVSVVAEAVAKCNEAVPFDALQPYEDNFHPKKSPVVIPTDSRKRNSRGVGNPFRAMHVVPLEHQVCNPSFSNFVVPPNRHP